MKPIRLQTLKAMGLWCMAIAGGLGGPVPATLSAQTIAKPQTVELASATPKGVIPAPKIRLVIPDLQLCPGQEYDLPVYIEISDTNTRINTFTISFRFPDHELLEPTGHISDIHESLRTLGNPAYNYNQEAFRNLPDHILAFSWIQTDGNRPLKVKSGQLLFRFRVKYKKEGEAKIDLVGGTAYRDATWFSCFTVNADEGSVLGNNDGNMRQIPDYMGVKPDYTHGTWATADTIQYTTAFIQTGKPLNISVIPDTMMCIGGSIHFWATGGERYEWKDVSGMERPYRPAMDDPREQNPLFKPLDAGIYTYQCKIVDKQGCVGYLYTKCHVRDNSLFLKLQSQDEMINRGAKFVSRVSFWNSPDYHYKLKWSPDTIIAGMKSLDIKTPEIPRKNEIQTYTTTKELYKATWITIDLADDFCHLREVQNVNVKGSPIESKITLDPPTVCRIPGKDNAGMTVQLSAQSHGGSGGQYHYQWSAKNLEDIGAAWEPIFQTDDNWAVARLLVYRTCEVKVKVIDYNGSTTGTFVDTIRVIEAKPVSFVLEDLSGTNISCEKEERTFAAHAVNAQNTKFEWYINDIEVLYSTDTLFTTSALKVGDKVHCIMKTAGSCVTANELRSRTIYPPVVYPGYMSASVSYGNGAVNDAAVGEKVSLNIAHRHTGDTLRLRWYSNDHILVYDDTLSNLQGPQKDRRPQNLDTTINHTVEVERTGYYDYYRAVVTSKRACLISDSLVTTAVQNLGTGLSPNKLPKAGTVYMDEAVEEGICEGDAFYAYARDIKYLPKEFRLVWYVQHVNPQDSRITPVAYYATPNCGLKRNDTCGTSYVNVAEYAAHEDFYRIQNWVLAGFKVSLLEGEGSSAGMIHGGDSLFYRIETEGANGTVVVSQSSKKVLKTRPSVYTRPTPNFVSDKDHLKRCEGEVFRFFPQYPSCDTIQYTWYVDGREIVPDRRPQNNITANITAEGETGYTKGEEQSGGRYPEIVGDTLITRLYNNVDIRMRATNTYQCYKPYTRYTDMTFTPSQMYTGFRIVCSPDTLICSGDSVALWAYGEPYRVKSGTIRRPSAPGVPDFLPEYESKILMSWAYSKEDLIAGKIIKDTALSIKVTIDSAAFGDRSADYNNPDAVVGGQRYYLRMTNYESGCTSYDSINVAVGYHRTPSIVVTPEPAFPWCEGMQGAYLKLSGDLWGSDTNVRVRLNSDPYWYYVAENRNDSLPYLPNFMKPGTKVDFKVTNPLSKSCNHQNTGYASVKLDIRSATLTFMRKGDDIPEEVLTTAVCAPDSIVIEGLGSTETELEALSGKRLTVNQIIDRVYGGYTYAWVDNTTGDTITKNRFLKVAPTVPTSYTLLTQDTAKRCAASKGVTQINIAVKADVNVKFFDSVLNKEVPLSICDGSESTKLSFKTYPTYFNEGAGVGWAVYSVGNYYNPREYGESYNKDTIFTALFKPGDRFVYAYLHDTIACNGKEEVMKSVDMQLRPFSRKFMAQPDTLLCGNNVARLRLEGTKRSASELPAGAPSLREYLIENNIVSASELPAAPMVYWATAQDGLTSSESTSFTPLVNPTRKAMYHVWGYNEYGCIQTDSARVERHDGLSEIKFKLTLPVDSVLCEADSLWFALDRYESSILSMFDSLVWKRIPAGSSADSGRPSGMINAEGVEILSRDIHSNNLYVHVEHGDVVYVDGYVAPGSKKICDNVATQTGWYRSNKIVVRSYKRPNLVLAQVEKEACVDSTLHLTAQTDAGAYVKWLTDPTRVRYEILGSATDRRVQIKTTSNEEGHVFTKVYAEAYNHPSCATRDSIEMEVKTTSDQNFVLVPLSTMCSDAPVTVRVNTLENVETWHWVIAPKNEAARDMTFEDFLEKDLSTTEDFLAGLLNTFTAPLKSGDRIWAEGFTDARCVSSHVVKSDTLTVSRGLNPVITWVNPPMKGNADRQMEGCAEEPLVLRWKLTNADNFRAMEIGSWTEQAVNFVEELSDGKVYEWVGTYPATPKDNPSANGVMRLQLLAESGNCRANDTLRIEAHPKDTLKIEIAATVSQICQGEEAVYGLLVREHIDSVVWYHNGMRMKSGSLEKAVSYTCRPNPGDRVWAVGYNRSTSACPVFNGIRSKDIVVNVIAGGRKPVGSLAAALSVSADSVCGFGQPVYTLRGKGFDSVYWFANGYLMAVTNVNVGITTNPDVVEATWQRTPRLSSLGLDSVYAVAVRTERLCAERDSVISKLAMVYRREMPQVKIEPRDASVWPGKDVSLSATGASRYVWWTDMQDDIAGLDQTFEFTMIDDTVGVYVMGYEPAYNEDSLAGGAALRPAANAYDKFGCRSFDQVVVKPATVAEDEVIIYIPNTVLLNSTRAADRVFKVFGERIASVEMRVFNSGGDLVFSKTAEDPVWNPQDVTTGNYSYRLVVTMKNGEKVNKNGWVSVLE